jgi:hypothetical protein
MLGLLRTVRAFCDKRYKPKVAQRGSWPRPAPGWQVETARVHESGLADALLQRVREQSLRQARRRVHVVLSTFGGISSAAPSLPQAS